MEKENQDVHSQITEFITKLIELSGVFKVIDGIIAYADTEEKIIIECPTGPKYITPYTAGDIPPGCIVINPFVEGVGDTKEKKWFYMIQSLTISSCIKRIFEFIINTALENKKSNKIKLDPEIFKLVEPYMSDIDEKVLSEFEILTNDKGKESVFFNIHYTKSNRTTNCYSALLDPDFESKNPDSKKLRKKTIQLFVKMMKDLLKTEDLKEYRWQSKNKFCPKFDSYLNVFWMLYVAIENALNITGVQYDVSFIVDHLPNLELYHTKSRWLIQPTSVSSNEGIDKATNQIPQQQNAPPAWLSNNQHWTQQQNFMAQQYSVPGTTKYGNVGVIGGVIGGGMPNNIQNGVIGPGANTPMMNSSMYNNQQFSYGMPGTFGNTNMFGNIQADKRNTLNNIINPCPF